VILLDESRHAFRELGGERVLCLRRGKADVRLDGERWKFLPGVFRELLQRPNVLNDARGAGDEILAGEAIAHRLGGEVAAAERRGADDVAARGGLKQTLDAIALFAFADGDRSPARSSSRA
jgi:hypothetical protein